VLVEHFRELPVPEADIEVLEDMSRQVKLRHGHLVGIDVEDVDGVCRLGDQTRFERPVLGRLKLPSLKSMMLLEIPAASSALTNERKD
jgi:hypothetical protein